MKKFLYRIGLILLLFLVIFVFLSYTTTKYVASGDYYRIPEDINTVVFGHSHSACSFNDSVIPGLYNLSQNTEGYPYTYFKIRTILKHNRHIENILVEYTNNQISEFASNRIYGIYIDENMPRMIPFIGKQNVLKWFWKSGNLKRNLNSTRRAMENYIEFILDEGENYIEEFWHNHEIPTHVYSSKIQKKEIVYDKYSFSIFDICIENLQYLVDIKNLCEANDVNFYIVRSPIPSHVNFLNESIFQSIRNTYFRDVRFLDFKEFPIDIEFFADDQHLNVEGSKIFSKYFRDSIYFEYLRQDFASD